MNIAVIGASKDRKKFGNKAVRAYLSKQYIVFPVNPNEREIEGLKCYSNILEIPFQVDAISVYLPPEIGIKITEDIIRKGIKKVYLNPGSESDDIIETLRHSNIEPILSCSIRAIGISPDSL